MKKILLLLMLCITFQSFSTPFDEGMWLPILLKKYNYEKMKKLGLKLTPEQLYDVNNASLKDAIVWFNGGCTGEIVSSEGLILTNHHCGYDAIAQHSTVENNILKNGFWAMTKAQEKNTPAMWVSILVRMEDVTSKVDMALKDVPAEQRQAKMAEVFKTLTADATKGTHYEATVKDMFRGNEFYLFVFEKFTDIRLVGTPPESVGKFGGDTDNWMWPRHTGDFSMFRIYANKDNKPAPFSMENVPYKPKHFLPVSLKGIKDGDFSMVYGFPGRTNRYETSFGIQLAVDETNPAIVKLRDKRLQLMKEQMDADPAVDLQLSSRYAQIANYWKYYIGQTEQLKRLKVYDQKQAEELEFTRWAASKQEYSSLLENMKKAYAEYRPYNLHRTYINEGIFGSSLAAFATAFIDLDKGGDTLSAETKTKIIAGIKARSEGFFKMYNPASDQKILAATLQMFYENIPADQHPAYMKEILKKSKGKTNAEKFENFAAMVYSKTFMTSREKLDAFLADPDLKMLRKDPAYKYASSFLNNYNEKYAKYGQAFNAAAGKEGKTYIKALREMSPDHIFYPDANSTLRLSYGQVQDYSPKDAVVFSYYTTLEGVMQKEIPGDDEFDVPERVKYLYEQKDFGRYANEKGELPVAFITNNDITGGNSGSPVINGDGELIGIAFDGNWEAMSGDIAFDKDLKRCINVDIRYVLFLMDKVGGATHLLQEMSLKGHELKIIQTGSFGTPFEEKGAITVKEMMNGMKSKNEMNVKVTAPVVTVCKSEGCWMEIDNGSGDKIMVKMKNHDFFLPKEIEGKTAIVQGVAKKEVTSVADLRHYAEDAGKSEKEINAITQPKTEIIIIAEGVILK
jgi:hypothetical protein